MTDLDRIVQGCRILQSYAGEAIIDRGEALCVKPTCKHPMTSEDIIRLRQLGWTCEGATNWVFRTGERW